MIWESGYWKADLVKDAHMLTRWARKKPSNRQYVLFEKKVFISAYVIRKLIEAEKIGSDFPMWNIRVRKFLKKTPNKIDLMNSHHTDRFYDFEHPVEDLINIESLSNSIIHSYIFTLKINESNEIDSLLFTSDFTKEKHLYEISIEVFANLLQWIGHSDIIKQDFKRNSDSRSGFKIKREYCFEDCIPRKGLPKKTKITYLSECIS